MAGSRLSCQERLVIERGMAAGLSAGGVAVVLGRHRTTVAREVARFPAGRYRADRADREACGRALRPQLPRLRGALAAVVSGLLEADWSPAQISAMLPNLYPGDDGMRVSHETIYKSLFVQGRGELRRELALHLRTARTGRKPRGTVQRRGKLIGMTPISQRPAEADDRAVPGHWEGDLLLGGHGKGAVITLVERASRFVLLAPLPGTHQATETRLVLTEMIGRLPAELKRSLTWDQGKEMAQHARFSLDTQLAVYFCDPHSPWQRGSNENTNGLLRQYWPKGADMSRLTQADCDAVAERLNTRPRQTLNWQTPAQALEQRLRATAA
jgi:transposase, IS30 family